ncbi:MAG: polysaccharide biosynthesis/export family protein [Candidatus Omnitrophota bacterium]
MLRVKNFILLLFILYFIGAMSEFALAEYKRIYTNPEDTSSKADVIKDREYKEKIEKRETELRKQKEALENPQKKSKPTKKKTTVVGKEPTKILYQVAINDKLYISVWRVPDLSLELIVGPDGKISFPLIGDIQAAGRTLSELDAEITEKLKDYVVDPQVSVIVREFAGDKVIIIGEVRTPGIYKFVGVTNIMDVIALAGGFTDRAKLSSILIARESADPSKGRNFIVANIKSILNGKISKNIEVEPNDIIYVSRTFVSNVKEFYDSWITPSLRTAIDQETLYNLRRIDKDK